MSQLHSPMDAARTQHIPVGLASKAQTLLSALAFLDESKRTDTSLLQYQLWILHDALRRIAALRPSCNVRNSDSLCGILQLCEDSFSTLDEALAETAVPSSDSSQRTKETNIKATALDDLRQRLAKDVNNLTLVARSLENGPGTSIGSLASTAGSLDTFCSWLLEQDILPSLTSAARKPGSSLFSVKSRVRASTTTSSVNDKDVEIHRDICLRAELIQKHMTEQPFRLNFRCRCEAEDHDDSLSFRRKFSRL
ncbi:hypothetical protein LX32DRAFT_166201 [Colletotrichum zoysiae]|uniref:Uncharacterized protein n=1 Tax=Colletotrichum zoysiae TaxID=1216348 RepID=A0AAD9H751_9PEZI|nr:hypothetical protein LX32DRAFT_166201 [Colletotrichum zoysiae]